MKHVSVIAAIFLLSSEVTVAQEDPSTQQILGAIAGGAIGSTIGSGDGRKAATVLGAIIGYRNGEAILGRPDRSFYYESSLDRRDRFEQYCKNEIPVEYSYDRNIAQSWVRGCTERLNRKQHELEQQAYLDGLRQ